MPKDLKGLCKTIGLEDSAFYFAMTKPHEPEWLKSDFTMTRKLKRHPVRESQILAEVIGLYQNGIQALTEELEMIQRFKRSFEETRKG